jgi:crotonobetainyl-CoA:carnitine CoA-transferase CaiB-like acyl-CoA transferase
MKEKTAAQWMEIYVAVGDVCADVVETTQEALGHPQMVGAGYLVGLDDPRVGRVVQVGPLAEIPTAPAQVRGPAPRPGEHTKEVLGSDFKPLSLSSPSLTALGAPLEGITIVETATFYATPFASALLGELGARVIKVEPISGDPYRQIEMNLAGGDPMRNLGHNNMVRAMQGKESILVDLKDGRGQEILHKLVAEADVFVHNFRPGVPESLGIDYETLRAVNPTLVYQYGSAYGSIGPYARQPAIDPIVAAFSGHTIYQAGEGNLPLTEVGADPIGAAGHAVAMILGIFARHRTGRSQYVESAMILSNLFANCEDALSYEGKPSRPAVDRLQFGTGATHRLYKTAASENDTSRWVFLAAQRDDEFARFCQVAGREDLTADPRYATAGSRQANRSALESLLEDVFGSRTAREWETTLLGAGVGCVRADATSNFAFLYTDPQAQALGMMTSSEHPHFGGTYWRHAPAIRLSQTPGRAGRFCAMGEHTQKILAELGYDEKDRAMLRESKVVAWPADQAEVAAAMP